MNTKELLNALEKVKPGISSKSSSEGMSYFYFSGTDVITYNDKISIQHPFETDFKLFVKANDLYKIVSKLSDEEIKITEKNNKLNITGKKIKSSLATIQDDEVSERIKAISDSLGKVKWLELPENFNESILLCSFTASNQISAGTLICVYLKENICVASDNSRISYATLDSEIDEMFIQASEIKNLISISPIKYAITQSWLHFKNEDGCVFSIRKIEGEFPDFMSLFDFEGVKIDLPKEIIEGIDIASILADVNDKAINIKIAKNTVILSAKSDGGKIMHRSKIDYNKEEINFSINPDFIKEMMKHNSHVSIGEGKAKLQTESFSLLTAFYN